MFNTPVHLSLAADIFLKEASTSEVSKKVVSAIDSSNRKKYLDYAIWRRGDWH